MPWERFELSSPFYGHWILSPACIPFHHHGLQRFCDLVILTSRRLFSRFFVRKTRCGFAALTRFQDNGLITIRPYEPRRLIYFHQLYDETVNAQGGIRTLNPLREADFESAVYTVPPPGHILLSLQPSSLMALNLFGLSRWLSPTNRFCW